MGMKKNNEQLALLKKNLELINENVTHSETNTQLKGNVVFLHNKKEHKFKYRQRSLASSSSFDYNEIEPSRSNPDSNSKLKRFFDEFETIQNFNDNLPDIFVQHQHILEELEKIKLELASSKEVFSMDDSTKINHIETKVNDLDVKVAVIEERTSHFQGKLNDISDKINKIPSEDKIKSILQDSLKEMPSKNDVKVLIDEQLNSKKIATTTDVELKISKTKNILILTSLTIAGLLFTALKLWL